MVILITSVGTATSVNLIKYTDRTSHKIVGADINDYGYTAGSLMCDSYYKVPYASDSSYMDIICDIIEKEAVEFVIPVNDIEIYEFASNMSRIACKCIIPDAAIIEHIRDKYLCSAGLVDKGFTVPDILKNDDTSVKRILRDRIGVGSKGISFVEEGISAGDYNSDKCFLQRCVEGDEYTVDVLCDLEGSPSFIIPRKRIEVKSGVATKVLVEDVKELIDIVSEMLNLYKLPGFSNFQFIKGEDGKFYFIEINYRFSGCGAATLMAVPDYLKIFYDMASGNKKSCTLNSGVKFNRLVTRYYEEKYYDI